MAVTMVMVMMVMVMMMVVMLVVVMMVMMLVVSVVDMHSSVPPHWVFYIIVSIQPNVKTFIFPDYPPGTVAPKPKKCYNTRRKEARPMSDQHDHAWMHGNGIPHIHENQKAVINRLARAIGHLNKVKRMVEEGHDCADVLIQLAAVRSAIDNTGKVILSDHIRHCMVDAVQAGDEDAIDDLCAAIDKFMK